MSSSLPGVAGRTLSFRPPPWGVVSVGDVDTQLASLHIMLSASSPSPPAILEQFLGINLCMTLAPWASTPAALSWRSAIDAFANRPYHPLAIAPTVAITTARPALADTESVYLYVGTLRGRPSRPSSSITLTDVTCSTLRPACLSSVARF